MRPPQLLFLLLLALVTYLYMRVYRHSTTLLVAGEVYTAYVLLLLVMPLVRRPRRAALFF